MRCPYARQAAPAEGWPGTASDTSVSRLELHRQRRLELREPREGRDGGEHGR